MAFNLFGQTFARFGIVSVKMDSQDILACVIFFDADTCNAWLTEQVWRVPPLHFAYLLFCSQSLPPSHTGQSASES